MWQKIFPKLPLGASEVVFKVIESSPARDDCLLFGWILVIKCVLDRKHFITNAKRGDYVYNLLIACLANTGKQWEPAIQCLPNMETQQRATLFSSVKALAKKHPPSSTCTRACAWPPVIFMTTTVPAHCLLRISGGFLKGMAQMYSKARMPQGLFGLF